MGIGRAARSRDSSVSTRTISLCPPTAQHGQSGAFPRLAPGMTHTGGHRSLQEAGATIQPGPQASAAQPTGQGVEV